METTMTDRLRSALGIVHWRNVPLMIVLLIGAGLMIMPFLWMVAASFRPIGESYRLPPSVFPDNLDLAAYREALSSGVPFLTMYWNSFVIAAATTIGTLVTSALAAFAFSRLEFRSREFLFIFMLLGLMVPPALVLIPLYFGYARIGLLDTHVGLALPAMASSFGVFMMRQFMLNLPKALEEAALLDGANYRQIFWTITLPQLGPALATLGIITFITSWNNFVSPFVLITSWDKMTLPVGIVALQGVMGSARLSVIMAAATMSILPLLLVFLVAQRFIVESITMSGVKG
ncbi:carbohydrate ABC transporter permease [Arsenicitalea aurantiaca]|uniref:Carbohydrate ABC transporter permease n=1 Tax=Arsenicitalea aurantiaca TaxID=1783274 RepID=A0A433XET6_9HYPH|nr:carbohydrate ABC transporter permease [Arsenicitalea aurantiaca]RUT32582.1 carbohydrate ABC transporter permease [Arsenicitalea aurantiaca]